METKSETASTGTRYPVQVQQSPVYRSFLTFSAQQPSRAAIPAVDSVVPAQGGLGLVCERILLLPSASAWNRKGGIPKKRCERRSSLSQRMRRFPSVPERSRRSKPPL